MGVRQPRSGLTLRMRSLHISRRRCDCDCDLICPLSRTVGIGRQESGVTLAGERVECIDGLTEEEYAVQ